MLESYIWKGEKVLNDNNKYVQNEYRLIDCSNEELKKYYNHCESMLYNEDKRSLGRYFVWDLISEQRKRCNAELFLRWMLQNGVTKLKFITDVRNFLNLNKKTIDSKTATVSEILIDFAYPGEFADIPIDLVLDACLDRLGIFERDHITFRFIIKQGIWLTTEEFKDLSIDGKSSIYDKLEIIKQRLWLNPKCRLYLNPKGLSYTQFRAMANLKSKKYSELTTSQLEILRDRILFALEDDVKNHIEQWQDMQIKLEEVAKSRGITLEIE